VLAAARPRLWHNRTSRCQFCSVLRARHHIGRSMWLPRIWPMRPMPCTHCRRSAERSAGPRRRGKQLDVRTRAKRPPDIA